MGTVFSDSSVARIRVGNTISARVKPPEITDHPSPRKITKNAKPNNPKMIEGIPAKIISHSLLGNVVRYRVLAHGVELSVDVLNRSVASLRADGSDIGLQLDLVTLREVA